MLKLLILLSQDIIRRPKISLSIVILSGCLCSAVLASEEPGYRISVTAECAAEGDKAVIDIKGDTDLPDGALIYVFFKRLDNFISSGETAVKDGKFSIRFGPLKKRLLDGEYTIEAVFMPERQPANVNELIKGAKDKQKSKLIRAVYALTIGNPEKAQKTQEEVKAEINSIISELEKLHSELTAMYSANKNNFNRQDWDKWSNNWFPKFKKIENKIRSNTEEYLIYLFPKAQENVSLAAQYLPCLHQAYSMEFKEPEKFAKILKNPDARAGPQMLNELFARVLAEAKSEVDSR